jgi:hypothetical protein
MKRRNAGFGRVRFALSSIGLSISVLIGLLIGISAGSTAAAATADDKGTKEAIPVETAIAPARASASDADVRRILAVFGIEQAMPQILAAALDAQPEFAVLEAKQKVCVRDIFRPEAEALLIEGFRQLFVDRETIDAWETFSGTSGGGKFFTFMQKVFLAAASGREPPPPAEVLAGMTDAELGDIQAFMITDAGKVLQKDFPSLDMDQKTIEAVEKRATAECGWQPSKS